MSELEDELEEAHALLTLIGAGDESIRIADRLRILIGSGVSSRSIEVLETRANERTEALDRLRKLAEGYVAAVGPDKGQQTQPWAAVRWVRGKQ